MLNRLKSIIVAGSFAAAAIAFGAVAFTSGAQAAAGGLPGIAKKAAGTTGIKAQTVQYYGYGPRCRPVFRWRWTPWGYRRVFVGRRCWRGPGYYGHYRPWGPRFGWRRGWNRGGWRGVRRGGWRRGSGVRLNLRFSR